MPIQPSLHPAWCDPSCHTTTHQDIEYHRSDMVTAHRSRGGHVDVWVDKCEGETADVVLRFVGDHDLKPVDARQLARVLLAAADIADGSAVTW